MNDILRVKRYRAMIGWLGMLLPIIVVVLQLFNTVFKWPQSISATWYTNACTPFMIILGAASLFLMCYHGYDWVDDLLNTAAGIFGLIICLFPCSMSGYQVTGTFLTPINISATLHNIGAIGFFGILAYNSLFQFTKSSGEIDDKKKKRNIIFRVCGIGMVASFLMLLLPSFPAQIWLMEAIALFFFGISWLTKANKYKWLFADSKEKK